MSLGAWDKLLAALAGEGWVYTDFLRVQATFFSARGCGADSDWLADVTLDRLARQIDAGARIDNFVAYTRGIAHHVYIRYCQDRTALRKATREMEYLSGRGVQEPEPRPDLRRRCQKFCLRTLSEEEQRLMVDYFLSDRSRAEIAREHGWSVGNLYVRICRIGQRLEECVRKCREQS